VLVESELLFVLSLLYSSVHVVDEEYYVMKTAVCHCRELC
jgi:hypothetical protein